ncbi:hypothetical protein ABWH96_20360 [Marivirga tractuosa]|uniref:hypothetical protein n=1 Tax=Marivirga tractuosa TaxID=1006 RepID=UPI0035D0FF48
MKKLMSIARLIFINLAIFLILLFVVNFLVGVYLKNSNTKSRADLPNYQDNREYARKIFQDYNKVNHLYEPFVGWKTKPYNGETTNIDEKGIRKTIAASQKSDSAKIVRFFGGSTLWGEGADDHNTIPSLFQKLNSDFKVYNHGQLAYNSRQNLDALISLYEEGKKSDIVIFYDGVNDAAFLCPSDVEVPGHRLVPMFRGKLYTSYFSMIKEAIGKIFFDKLILLSKKINPAERDEMYNCLSSPEKAEAIADFMLTNWEIAHDIVTSRGGKFYAILQPAAYVGNPRVDHLDLGPVLGENFRQVYKLFYQKIKEKQYPWVYDLSASFNGNEHIFIDFCHVSPNGNQIIAKEINAVLE